MELEIYLVTIMYA